MIERADPVYVAPETARILQAAAEAGLVERASLSPAGARAHMETASRIWNDPLPDMTETKDFAIEGVAGRIGMRLLRPRDRADRGVIVYFHGGGFVL